MSGEPLSLNSQIQLEKRHYKKDSRFVLDLYTLCYDENESVDTVELFTSIVNNTADENWVQQVISFVFVVNFVCYRVWPVPYISSISYSVIAAKPAYLIIIVDLVISIVEY